LVKAFGGVEGGAPDGQENQPPVAPDGVSAGRTMAASLGGDLADLEDDI
jgi:hypothetical protein